ncbi:MAG: hypothetical protein LCI00_28270 [Chloroflexi bacterium]|nr:hypothetical protein [Chloroflexota bacterium]
MKNAQTVLAVYDSFESADRAIRALVDDGFSRADIGLAANDVRGDYNRLHNPTAAASEDVSGGEGGSFGAVIGGITGAVAALTAIVIPGIGPVIAAGPLVALLGGATGAVVGGAAGAVTGGLAASLIHLGVPEAEATHYGESVRRGNALVTVTVDNDEDAETATNVMRRYNPVDVKSRASKWRESGWAGYDAEAQPYTTDELNRERELYPADTLPEEEVVNRYYPTPRS